MTDLVRRLRERYPVPESAIHAHSRHYMPGKGDKRTLVSMPSLGSRMSILSSLSGQGLPWMNRKTEVLDALLENLGFLGRAES